MFEAIKISHEKLIMFLKKLTKYMYEFFINVKS